MSVGEGVLRAGDREALEAWALGSLHGAATPTTGAVNRTVLIQTARGRYVLRAYRHAQRQPVEVEHALIAYAHARGLPVLKPIPFSGSETILERDGRFYALFPHAPGAQILKYELDEAAIGEIGAFLAHLHVALLDFPQDRVGWRAITIDRAATLAGIDSLLNVIRSRPSLDEVDQYALRRLNERHAWLEGPAPAVLPDLQSIERQVIHGDYQETNLFFKAGKISAIIDWDQAYVASRAWEVVRTLHYVCGLETVPCRTLLAAYRAQLPLGADELDLAAEAYGLMRAHDLWHFKSYYLDGNDRVRQWIMQGSFIPFWDRWAQVAPTLR